MALFSFSNLVLLVVSVAAYYAYSAYVQHEHAQRAKQFALDQRRRAGIPDTDSRPFGIARADALKQRQQRQDAAARLPRPAPLKSNSGAGSPRHAVRSSPMKQASAFGSALAQPGYLRLRSSGSLRSQAQTEAEPRWPGAFDEHSSPPRAERLYPTMELAGPLSPDERAIVWSSPSTRKHGLSDSDSLTGSVEVGHSRRKTAKVDQENLERRAITARTSRKRGPSEARDGVDDSVAGDRVVKRRTDAPLREIPVDASYGPDGDEDYVMDESLPIPLQAGRRGKKRDVDEVDDGEGTVAASTRVIRSKKRGKAAVASPPPIAGGEDLSDLEYQLEDAEMASLSDFNADRIETDRESVADVGDQARLTPRGKRKVDTSDDREPGDEWTDLNGLRWKIGEDGIRRRATVVVEMRPKYNMPKDSQHPDAKQKIQVYVERFLSEEEYEEAKRKKLLGFQEAERQRDAEAKQKAAEEAAAKAAEDAAAGRNLSTPRKLRNNDLLHSDSVVRHSSPLRAVRSDFNLKRSVGTPPRQGSTPLRDSTPNSSAKINKRISLSASNSAGVSLTSSPASGRGLTPSRRSGLDEESKRRREETLLRKLREEKEAKEAAASPKASPAPQAAPSAPLTPFAPPSSSTPTSAQASSATASVSAATSNAPVSASNLFAGLASAKKADSPAKPEEQKPAAGPSFSFGSKPAMTSSPSVPSTAPAVQAGDTKTESKPSFSFAASPATASPSSKVAEAKPGFSFGAPPKPSSPDVKPSGPVPSFSFGTPASSSPKTEPALTGGSAPAPSTPSFSFGAPASASNTSSPAPAAAPAGAANASSPFTFGAPASSGAPKTETKPSVPPFTFGAPAKAEEKPKAPTPASTFTFGASSASTPAQPSQSATPAPSFTFGAPAGSATKPASNGAAPSFSFGTPPAASSSTGASKGTFTFGTPSSNAGGSSAGGTGGFTFSMGKK